MSGPSLLWYMMSTWIASVMTTLMALHYCKWHPHEWPSTVQFLCLLDRPLLMTTLMASPLLLGDIHRNGPLPFSLMSTWSALADDHYFGWHPHEWPSPVQLMSTWSALADDHMNGLSITLSDIHMSGPLPFSWMSTWSALADGHINGPSAPDDVRMNGPAACAGNERQWGDKWLQLLLKHPQVSLSNIYVRYAQNYAATMKSERITQCKMWQ